MANKEFKIQSNTVSLNGVPLSASVDNKVVIPGITRATGFRVEEVDSRDDYEIGSLNINNITVIDNAQYEIYNGTSPSQGFVHAEYTAEWDDGELEEIQVTNPGLYQTAESTSAQNNNMWITDVANAISNWNSGDWTQIPFRPKFKADSVESEFGGGGASSLEDLDDVNVGEVEDGDMLRWDSDEEEWVSGSIPVATTSQLGAVKVDGTTITISNDGVISAVSSELPGSGYFTELKYNTTEADGNASAMDSDGNSYISFTYYDDNAGRDVGGILKLNTSGEKVWEHIISSQNSDVGGLEITSLVLYQGSLVALGNAYNNGTNKSQGFFFIADAATGAVGGEFDSEVADSEHYIYIRDGVFGFNGNGPFAVMAGNTYGEYLVKSLTLLSGSAVDRVEVSHTELAANNLAGGNEIVWQPTGPGGNSYYGYLYYEVTASPDGSGWPTPSIYLRVFWGPSGYQILGSNGWNNFDSWNDQQTLVVLGTSLGGTSPANDLTFTFDKTIFNYNSDNLLAAVSNISGTTPTNAVIRFVNGFDFSTEIGNILNFRQNLNSQAYFIRLGNNSFFKSMGGNNSESIYSVDIDSNGNIYAVGYYDGNKSGLVMKVDSTGALQWSQLIDPDNNNITITSVSLTSDGNHIICVDEDDGVVTKMSTSDGSISWQVRISDQGISWDENFAGTMTPENDYIITNYEDDDDTVYVIRLSGVDGSVMWSHRISRFFSGQNGDVQIGSGFNSQCISCNSTHVTIAGSSDIYLNGNGYDNGLVINIPSDGSAEGTYGQYIIADGQITVDTFTTTPVPITLDVIDSDINSTTQFLTNSSTPGLTYDATSIGGGGGTGNITFDGSRLSSPATFNGDFPNGVITLAPGNSSDSNYADNGQFINIYPTNNYDAPHIHVAPGSGNNGTGDLILGLDSYHIDINNNGNIYIKTNDQNYVWNFDSNGNLTLPNGGDIRDSSGTSVLGGGGTQGIQGIQGADGLQGLQGGEGLQGLPGMDGAPGSPGMDGSPGSPGMDGLQGLQGGEGVQGVQGLQGADGVQGAAGNIISISSEPPSSPTSGQVYYDSDDGNIYIYTGSAWVDSSPSGGGTTLPANANGYLNNDGTGTLTWVAGNPAGSGSLPYSDVWVLSTKTDAFWTSYMLNGTIAPLFNFGQYPLTLTASNQPAYGKQMVSGQKICVVNDAAIHSSVNYYGLVFEFPSSPAVGDTWIPWHNTQSQTVNAGSFIVGKTYSISSPGNTTWTSIGSVGNEVNRTFIATGAGSGSGTAKTTVGVDRLILLPASGQKVLTMNISGTTSFGQGTATVATYLDILNNSNPICFIYAGVLNGTPTWIHSYF